MFIKYSIVLVLNFLLVVRGHVAKDNADYLIEDTYQQEAYDTYSSPGNIETATCDTCPNLTIALLVDTYLSYSSYFNDPKYNEFLASVTEVELYYYDVYQAQFECPTDEKPCPYNKRCNAPPAKTSYHSQHANREQCKHKTVAHAERFTIQLFERLTLCLLTDERRTDLYNMLATRCVGNLECFDSYVREYGVEEELVSPNCKSLVEVAQKEYEYLLDAMAMCCRLSFFNEIPCNDCEHRHRHHHHHHHHEPIVQQFKNDDFHHDHPL